MSNSRNNAGLTKTREYITWISLKGRCLNPENEAYDRYGGRGIKVCDRWLGREGFKNFLADMGPRPSPLHSIERDDNDGPYSPDNCYWATKTEQALNRRSNRRITHQGETRTVFEWARSVGLPPKLLWKRLFVHGWSFEKSIATPKNHKASTQPMHEAITKHFVLYLGERLSVGDLARRFNLNYRNLYRRIVARGKPVEAAVDAMRRRLK